MSLTRNSRMFFVETIPGSAEATNRMALSKQDRRIAYLFIIQHLKESAELRKAVIAAKAIPLEFETNMLALSNSKFHSCYELEMKDLPEFLAVFKERDSRIMVFRQDTPEEEVKRAINELHEVFRILRTTVKNLERRLAVAMGAHDRLGPSSLLFELDSKILRIVALMAEK